MSLPTMIYLAGPITGVGDEARGWRIHAARMMPGTWQAIDPLVIEAASMNPEYIVQLDYSWLERSSGVICRVDRPSWGTAMELAYARQLNLPVVGFGTIEGTPSPWLLFHVNKIVPTLAEAIDTLKGILK